jgi:hypothetical protein
VFCVWREYVVAWLLRHCSTSDWKKFRYDKIYYSNSITFINFAYTFVLNCLFKKFLLCSLPHWNLLTRFSCDYLGNFSNICSSRQIYLLFGPELPEKLYAKSYSYVKHSITKILSLLNCRYKFLMYKNLYTVPCFHFPNHPRVLWCWFGTTSLPSGILHWP